MTTNIYNYCQSCNYYSYYAKICSFVLLVFLWLTLQTVCVEKLLAFFMAFDSTLWAAHALPSNTPQQTLTLIAVGGRCGRPHFKVMGRRARNRVNESLEGLLVHMIFLQKENKKTLISARNVPYRRNTDISKQSPDCMCWN